MAGVDLSKRVISLWAAVAIRQQGALVCLLALGVFLAEVTRLVSISRVGLPKPTIVWLDYLIAELVLPLTIAGARNASH
jgi:hypothetical protein